MVIIISGETLKSVQYIGNFKFVLKSIEHNDFKGEKCFKYDLNYILTNFRCIRYLMLRINSYVNTSFTYYN